MMTKCKLCDSRQIRIINRINRYKLMRCLNCEVVFVAPIPTSSVIRQKNLEKYESHQSEVVYFNMQHEFFRRAQKCVDVLFQYNKKSGDLLDVGCSYGFYLKVFNHYGYKSMGIDISARAVKYGKKQFKLTAVEGNFESYPFKSESFDVITLFDVFEHFANPQIIINKIKKLLKNEGIIVIQTPNFDSLMAQITGLNWFWLLIPQHLFLYSVHSLKFFLNKNGFRILKISTWDDFNEFTSNTLWLLGIKNTGKTRILHKLLIKIIWIFKPIAVVWNYFHLGGELLVYAQKED